MRPTGWNGWVYQSWRESTSTMENSQHCNDEAIGLSVHVPWRLTLTSEGDEAGAVLGSREAAKIGAATPLVGRAMERARFEEWLSSSASPLLIVIGPPGMGRTSLLQAFAERAEELGCLPLWCDARVMPRIEEAHEEGQSPLPLQRVVFWDSDGLPEPKLSEVCSALSVHAGMDRRFVWAVSDLPEGECRALPFPVPTIRLDALSEIDAESLLRFRGDVPVVLIEGIVHLVGGYPLGLMLAGDLAARCGAPLVECSEWPPLRRRLVRHWLGTLSDPSLVSQIEAAGQVHRFDQDLLLALTEGSTSDPGFDRLLGSSFVHAAGRSLAIHRDLRRIMDADLRWRRPVHHAALHQRAMEHYRQRWHRVGPEERESLAVDFLYLCDDPVVHALCFAWEAADVRVDEGDAADHSTLCQLWSGWISHTFGIEPPSDEVEELQRILHAPGTRARVVRDQGGQLLGFSAILPVSSESVGVLQGSHVAATLIQACWSRTELAALAQSPEASMVFFIHHMAWAERRSKEVVAALLQDALGLLAHGGIYLASAAHADLQRLLGALGFRRVDAAVNPSHDPLHPVVGYELDLSGSGFLGWMEDFCAGRISGGIPRSAELERDLQNILARWKDDAWLARSPVTHWPALAAVESGSQRAELLRRFVGKALQEALAETDEDGRRALKALELAYLNDASSHRVAAAELRVSRATFYRLLPRGMALLAERLRQILRHPPKF